VLVGLVGNDSATEETFPAGCWDGEEADVSLAQLAAAAADMRMRRRCAPHWKL
jgi:hypothetical protein